MQSPSKSGFGRLNFRFYISNFLLKESMMSKFRLAAFASLMSMLATTPVLADDSVHVAFTGTMTGDFAVYGVGMKKGFDLAVEQINARGPTKLTVESADDHGQPNEGVLTAGRFCGDSDTVAIVGYTFSSIALAAVPILNKCKIPVIGTGVTSPSLTNVSPYFRRVILTDATQGALMGQYAAKQMKLKRIYTLYQQDDYGMGVDNAFKKAATGAGAEVIGDDGYLLGTKDFRTILTKVKSEHPDAIFIGGFYTETAGIVEQAKALGINAKMLGTDSAMSPQLVQLSNDAVDGMTLYGMFDADASSTASPQGANFVKTFVAKYGQAPDNWSALGYDAGLALGEAIKQAKAKGPITRASINEALSNIHGMHGATGTFSFDKNGDREGNLYFFQVRNQKFALVGEQK